MTRNRTSRRTALLAGIVASLIAYSPLSRAHVSEHFSAGEPGDPKKPFRTIEVSMRDGDDGMSYRPKLINVRQGEQIKFVLKNDGVLKHEFVLANTADNLKHAELMRKYPDMEHDDPNAKSLEAKVKTEILWRFTKKGEFEYACLIPGHRESGMIGKIVVK